MTLALTNAHVLTDDGWQEDLAVVLDGEYIAALVPRCDSRLQGMQKQDLGGAMLLPGFIDVQVNGGGGVLFNEAPTVETIRRIGAAHRRYGTTGFVPTLISDDPAVMRAALLAVEQALAEGVPGLLGIHLEGPYLAPARKGVHDAKYFHVPSNEELALLCAPHRGVRIVTLAPDQVPPASIRMLADAGVIVCAGHTAADYATTRAALDAGVRGFTHLFNAMTPFGSREPGVVGAALDDPESWCGIIVDGHHVHPASLRVAIAAKARGKMLLVTDAMPPVGADSPSARPHKVYLPVPRWTWLPPCATRYRCSACRWTRRCAWRALIRPNFSDWVPPTGTFTRAVTPIWWSWTRTIACCRAGSAGATSKARRETRGWARTQALLDAFGVSPAPPTPRPWIAPTAAHG